MLSYSIGALLFGDVYCARRVPNPRITNGGKKKEKRYPRKSVSFSRRFISGPWRREWTIIINKINRVVFNIACTIYNIVRYESIVNYGRGENISLGERLCDR